MTFNEWFKKNTPSNVNEHTRFSYQFVKDAFEAGLYADVDNSKVIAELEASLAEWQRTCEAKSDTNSQLIEQLVEKNEIITELKKRNTALRQEWEVLNNTVADYGDFCDKYIALEKENKELKESVDFWEERYWILNDVYTGVVNENNNKFAKAKEIITYLLRYPYHANEADFLNHIAKAEAFLSEVEECW